MEKFKLLTLKKWEKNKDIHTSNHEEKLGIPASLETESYDKGEIISTECSCENTKDTIEVSLEQFQKLVHTYVTCNKHGTEVSRESEAPLNYDAEKIH